MNDSMMEPLRGVITAVPRWNLLLDDLNGKIANRQLELAQVADSRPPTRSIKHKGSTESLRPKDGGENPFHDDEHVAMDPPPPLTKSTVFPTPNTPPKSLTTQLFAVPAPPSSPAQATLPMQRRTSHRLNTPQLLHSKTTPTSPPTTPHQIRKRKTGSVTSAESQIPKYRTRSMIIVYYDSAVQDAFEELVKLISASRNAMRKGKMAARMAEMRKMADLEIGDESDDEDGGDTGFEQVVRPVASQDNGAVVTGDDEDGEYEIPKLKFISTRRMGPSRDALIPSVASQGRPANKLVPSPAIAAMGSGMLRSANMVRGRPVPSLSGGRSVSANIYDELDAGLEWCQSMCEHAAHQFLRDGDCGIEIDGIKRRLGEVSKAADIEVKKTESAEAAEPSPKANCYSNGAGNGMETGRTNGSGKMREFGKVPDPSTAFASREFRTIQMRKQSGPGPNKPIQKTLEVDPMEVDDEGVEDMDLKLTWVSAKDRVL